MSAAPVLILHLVLFSASGCHEPQETVEYDVTYGSVHEFVFSRPVFGATDAEPEVFSTPVQVEQQLVFSGQVDAEKPKRKKGYLKIQKQHKGVWVTFRSGLATLEADEEGDGFQFRCEAKAPRLPGKYVVKLKAGDAVFALGEIVVEDG